MPTYPSEFIQRKKDRQTADKIFYAIAGGVFALGLFSAGYATGHGAQVDHAQLFSDGWAQGIAYTEGLLDESATSGDLIHFRDGKVFTVKKMGKGVYEAARIQADNAPGGGI